VWNWRRQCHRFDYLHAYRFGEPFGICAQLSSRSHQGKYGKEYLLETPRKYASKSKNAQEAHEAIRPTDLMRDPESIKDISIATNTGFMI
jgi:hypothetical protein